MTMLTQAKDKHSKVDFWSGSGLKNIRLDLLLNILDKFVNEVSIKYHIFLTYPFPIAVFSSSIIFLLSHVSQHPSNTAHAIFLLNYVPWRNRSFSVFEIGDICRRVLFEQRIISIEINQLFNENGIYRHLFLYGQCRQLYHVENNIHFS